MKHAALSARTTLVLIALLFGMLAPTSVLSAQDDKPEKAAEEKSEAKKEDKKADDEEEEEEDEDDYFAVVGGDVYTVTRGVLRGATVLAKNGRIHDIGHDVDVPEEANLIDATGLRVYPGLVACASSQIVGSEPPEQNTDVFSLNMVLGLSTGLTTVVTGNTAAKLTYGTLDGILLKKNLFIDLRLRSAADWRKFREDMDKIRDHRRKMLEYKRQKDAGEEVEEPKAQGLNANYQKLLSGEVLAKVGRPGRGGMNSAGDLRKLARLAQEYGFQVVVFGAREGWIVADELGRAGISCVITPRTTRDTDPESNRPNGPRIENAAMLHDRGVPVAVIPGSQGIATWGLVGQDMFTMPVEAAYAIRGGLSRQAALESITITAARVLGIDDHVGSLEVGKDADIIVTDGDILHYKTMVHYSVVNGRLAYDKAEESLLSHIRPLEGESRFREYVEQALEETHPEAEEGEGEGEEAGDGEGEPTEGEGGDESGESGEGGGDEPEGGDGG